MRMLLVTGRKDEWVLSCMGCLTAHRWWWDGRPGVLGTPVHSSTLLHWGVNLSTYFIPGASVFLVWEWEAVTSPCRGLKASLNIIPVKPGFKFNLIEGMRGDGIRGMGRRGTFFWGIEFAYSIEDCPADITFILLRKSKVIHGLHQEQSQLGKY